MELVLGLGGGLHHDVGCLSLCDVDYDVDYDVGCDVGCDAGCDVGCFLLLLLVQDCSFF